MAFCFGRRIETHLRNQLDIARLSGHFPKARFVFGWVNGMGAAAHARKGDGKRQRAKAVHEMGLG